MARPKNASPYWTNLRTHSCGELTEKQVGESVLLCGAVDRHHDKQRFELRDGYGRTEVRLTAEALETLMGFVNPPETPEADRAAEVPLETIVGIDGTVTARESADPDHPTGAIYIDGKDAVVMSPAKSPLLFGVYQEGLKRWDRTRFRYLYLRRPSVHKAFRFRTRLIAEMRRFLAGERFEEVGTPLLANRWTPEAGHAFLAIRNRGEIFSLPGRRPVHAGLVMASGFDRAYEVARRFRRQKTYGPWQQPEFSVLDAQMAYIGEADLHRTEDALLAHTTKVLLGGALEVQEISCDDALARYGTSAPDLRFDLELQDGTAALGGAGDDQAAQVLGAAGAAKVVRVPGGAAKVEALGDLSELLPPAPSTEEGADESAEESAGEDAEVSPPAAWIFTAVVGADGVAAVSGSAPAALGAPTAPLAAAAAQAASAEPGDAVLCVVARSVGLATEVAGAVRARAGEAFEQIAPGSHALVRVTRLPYYRYDGAADAWSLAGDPVTLPVESELADDPKRLHGQAHYLVLDGVNVGGGAVRHHDPAAQRALLSALGFEPLEVDRRFGQLLSLLRYGVPPHGRFAIGVDRLAALLQGLPTVDEMIPLPKTEKGTDPLARAPWPTDIGLIPAELGHG